MWNWGTFYEEIVKLIRNGTWHSTSTWFGMRQGIVDLAPFGPMVSQAIKEKVIAKKAEIMSGKDDIFTGPIKDQQGKIQIAKDQTATDEELLSMQYFVQGVIGSLK